MNTKLIRCTSTLNRFAHKTRLRMNEFADTCIHTFAQSLWLSVNLCILQINGCTNLNIEVSEKSRCVLNPSDTTFLQTIFLVLMDGYLFASTPVC